MIDCDRFRRVVGAAAGIIAIGLLLGCDRGATPATDPNAASVRRSVRSGIDTLQLPADALIATPVWVTEDAGGDYVIVDQSDRDIKIVSPNGTLRRRLGRAGPNEGEFAALTGGGALGTEVMAYDFVTERMTVFDREGSVREMLGLSASGRSAPLAVYPVEDSLLLAVQSPVGNDEAPLVHLIDRAGRAQVAMFRQDDYFDGDPELIQAALVVAAAGHGIVAAGLLSADSLWVFDYDGRRLGAAQLSVDGKQVPTARQLRAANGGAMRRTDGVTVLAGHTLLAGAAVLDSATVLVQLITYPAAGTARLDRTAGGHLLAYRVNRDARRLDLVRSWATNAGLVGQTSVGEALLLRYADDSYRTVTIERVTTGDVAAGDVITARQEE